MRIACYSVIFATVLAGCARDQRHGATTRATRDAQFESAQDPPITADTRFAAGQLAESQNDTRRAIAQYEAALKLDSRHRKSLYRLAIVHAQIKQYPQAIETWKQFVEATDGAPAGYSNLGFCCELAGKPEEAEVAYIKGIEKDPKHQPTRVNYGLMLARHGRINEAIIQLQAVLKPAEVHYNLASIFEQQGRKEAAKVEFRKALAEDPNFMDAKSRLARLE